MRTTAAVAVVGAAAAAVAVHAPLWPAAFYFDDHAHLLLAGRMTLGEAVSEGLFDTYYRPLGQASWWLLARSGVEGPSAAHVVLAVLIGLTLWLVASCLRRAGTSRGVAAGAAVAGALLPTTVVTAAWVSNVYGVLSALAGWGAVRVCLGRRAAWAPWLAGGLLVASLAAKEDGAVFAVAAVVLAVGKAGGRRWIAVAVAAVAAVVVWAVVRTLALAGGGTLLAAGSLPPAGIGVAVAIVATALLAGAVAVADARLRLGLALASVAVPVAGVMWALAPADPQTPDLRLRFGYLVGLAVVPVGAAVAERVRAGGRVLRAVGTAVLVVVAALLVAADLRAVAGWRARTAAADQLVERVVRQAEDSPERRLALVLSPVPEIGLDPAVRLRLGDRAPVVVRPGREAFVVVPAELWPAVRGRIAPTPLPGNPARVAGLVVVHGFALPPAWSDPDPKLGPAIVVR